MEKKVGKYTLLATLVWCIFGISKGVRHEGVYHDESWRCPQNLPETTIMVTFNQICYQYVDREWYWPSARDYCMQNGGHLVTVNDPDTNDFIVWTLNNLPWRNRGLWIGLHDRNGEMDWEWVTDHTNVAENLEWSNWGRGHPRGMFHTFRDCIRMVRGKGDWKWHETVCSALRWKYRFICQYNMAPTTPAATTTTLAPTSTNATTEQDQQGIVIRHGRGEFRPRGDVPGNENQILGHSTSSEEEDEEDDSEENEVLVPLELKHYRNVETIASKGSGVTIAVIACVIGILSATVILAIFFVRRRRQSRLKIEELTMENPIYGDDCSRKPYTRAQNEYTVNVYSNPLPAVQKLVAKNIEDAMQREIDRSSTENLRHVHFGDSTLDALSTHNDGYEAPRIHDYLSMDGTNRSQWNEPSNTQMVIRRPVSQEYVMPSVDNIYAEIPEVYPESNIYETLDEVQEEHT
jgi:hypothetical protein